MTRPTLFVQLSTRFGAQPERLAAEALAFLLSRSAAVRAAVVDLCAIAMPSIATVGTGLRFSGDLAGEQNGVCGLIGCDAEGAIRVIVDGRFWSALSSDQPVRSLRHLTTHGEGATLLLAPSERFTSLWAGLLPAPPAVRHDDTVALLERGSLGDAPRDAVLAVDLRR